MKKEQDDKALRKKWQNNVLSNYTEFKKAFKESWNFGFRVITAVNAIAREAICACNKKFLTALKGINLFDRNARVSIENL